MIKVLPNALTIDCIVLYTEVEVFGLVHILLLALGKVGTFEFKPIAVVF